MSFKLTRSQIEYLHQETKNLSGSDFTAVLNYYGIAVKRNSILCIMQGHHDTHYGSCMIARNGKEAYCFVCHKTIDGVQVVMEKEGLNYPNAMAYLWCQILGNSIPMAEEDDNRPPISYKEMQFIGINGCYGGEIMLPYNVCDKCEDIEDKRYDGCQKDGTYLVARSMNFPSIFKLYETNRSVALSIMFGKAKEAILYYEKLLRDMEKPNSKIRSLVYDEALYTEYKDLIMKNLKKANQIQTKLKEAVS